MMKIIFIFFTILLLGIYHSTQVTDALVHENQDPYLINFVPEPPEGLDREEEEERKIVEEVRREVDEVGQVVEEVKKEVDEVGQVVEEVKKEVDEVGQVVEEVKKEVDDGVTEADVEVPEVDEVESEVDEVFTFPINEDSGIIRPLISKIMVEGQQVFSFKMNEIKLNEEGPYLDFWIQTRKKHRRIEYPCEISGSLFDGMAFIAYFKFFPIPSFMEKGIRLRVKLLNEGLENMNDASQFNLTIFTGCKKLRDNSLYSQFLWLPEIKVNFTQITKSIPTLNIERYMASQDSLDGQLTDSAPATYDYSEFMYVESNDKNYTFNFYWRKFLFSVVLFSYGKPRTAIFIKANKNFF
ncbi:hypothetical protein HMI54_000750 [Coelomomyces lativittatus]|nr:hypothetical protein HMI54_000750 [Coelomomyces lativittatus]